MPDSLKDEESLLTELYSSQVLNVSCSLKTKLHLRHVMRKPAFSIYGKTKGLISCAVTPQLIRAFVFTA